MDVTFIPDVEPDLSPREEADLDILRDQLREAWESGNLTQEWAMVTGIASILWKKAGHHVIVEGLQ